MADSAAPLPLALGPGTGLRDHLGTPMSQSPDVMICHGGLP